MKEAFNVDISDISILPQDLVFSSEKLPEFFQNKVYEKTQNGKKVLDGRLIRMLIL